uniref:NOC3-like protein n=1 Tax=Cacopsylla melanoneura TaxID=428564 RepID=A0A8D8WFX0_9HEMI
MASAEVMIYESDEDTPFQCRPNKARPILSDSDDETPSANSNTIEKEDVMSSESEDAVQPEANRKKKRVVRVQSDSDDEEEKKTDDENIETDNKLKIKPLKKSKQVESDSSSDSDEKSNTKHAKKSSQLHSDSSSDSHQEQDSKSKSSKKSRKVESDSDSEIQKDPKSKSVKKCSELDSDSSLDSGKDEKSKNSKLLKRDSIGHSKSKPSNNKSKKVESSPSSDSETEAGEELKPKRVVASKQKFKDILYNKLHKKKSKDGDKQTSKHKSKDNKSSQSGSDSDGKSSPNSSNVKKSSNQFGNKDLYDAETSEGSGGDEVSDRIEHETEHDVVQNKKTNKKKKETKPAQRKSSADALEKIHAETQRLIRESSVSLPYFLPKTRSISEFMEKRKPIPAIPLRAKGESLGSYIHQYEERVKSIKETYKQMEEEEEHEEEKEAVTDYVENERRTVLQDEEPVTTAQLMASREGVIQKYKFKIGILASGLLENPDEKIKNLKLLLDIMRSRDPELRITVKKLVILSLMEVFKDLLPSYAIKHHNAPGTKLKKDTLKLQTYENNLLKGYKDYLALLEYNASVLTRKRGDTRKYPAPIIEIGELAVNCFCDLLIAHPYFNFSHNIVQLLTVFLDSTHPPARKIVHACYARVFKEDKKGAISLVIVRRINQLVKARSRSHPEIISVLLNLRIKDINLDKEKEDELKKKRFMSRQEKLIRMSRRERKNNKKAIVLEQELLETKAEENKQVKQNYMTEVTKLVFTIYFRILKKEPRSKLLSATLEGLAKFAHCINLDFYQDLVNVLDSLMRTEPLTVREQMHCVQTVFTILSGQGEMLSIDPMHFYTHLYKNLLYVHIGKTQPDLTIMLDTFQDILIRRRKNLSQAKILAFTKRLGTLALQIHQHGALAVMALVKSVLQLTKCGDMLLEPDNALGQGIYEPYIEEPEYCNANATSLWELSALQRHYHPTVQKLATHLMNGAPPTGNGSLPTDLAKTSATEFYSQYDPTEV